MSIHIRSKLDPKKRYLQVALNNTLEDARRIISSLPISDRIIIEAGTPLIKKYGQQGIRQIRSWYEAHILGQTIFAQNFGSGLADEQEFNASNITLGALISEIGKTIAKKQRPLFISPTTTKTAQGGSKTPYIVADLKTMDRGETEVSFAAEAGASAAIALGNAPIETLNSFILACEANGMDAMIDMMNVEYPLSVLRALKKIPPVVILHRGVDEERDNREKRIPLHEIRRIKGAYNIMISIAGGDTIREVQSSIFNDADIVVVWKSVFQESKETVDIVNGFLKAIK